jgi:hypothetical protein
MLAQAPVQNAAVPTSTPTTPSGSTLTTTNTSAQTVSTTTQPTTSSASAQQVTPRLVFENLTTGDTGRFYVGDSWRITITGPAGAALKVTGGKDGGSATEVAGSIPSSGTWVKTGAPTNAEIGSWVQSWSVGGQTVATLRFVVQAKPSYALQTYQPDTSIQTNTVSTTVTTEGQTISDVIGSPVGISVASDEVSTELATDASQDALSQIVAKAKENWMWVLATAAGALYLMRSKR